MGSRGPVPKRDAERVRANKPDIPTAKGVRGGDGTLRGPDLVGEHSELATRWYESLRRSGQADFYEASDWATAEILVVSIDAYVRKPTALMLSSIMSGMSNLLVTEGDRRRVRLELEDPDSGEDASVTALDDYRNALGG